MRLEPTMRMGADMLNGRVALVTGGGSGIGRATAARLARDGARVYVTDLKPERAMAAAAGIGSAAEGWGQNVASEDDWRATMERITASAGRLDILVNNAGFGLPGDPEHTSLQDWRKVFAANADGVFLGCRAAIAAMKEAGGAIVNLSSCAAFEASPGLVSYGASKAVVLQLTKSVAVYCARKGYRIRCNSVHPGPTMTGLMRASIDHDPDPEARRRYWLDPVPMDRFAEPEEMAALIAFLVSDEASYVTGAAMVADGGLLAAGALGRGS